MFSGVWKQALCGQSSSPALHVPSMIECPHFLIFFPLPQDYLTKIKESQKGLG